MSDQTNGASKSLASVLDALQKSLLEASDESVMKDLQDAGVDPLKAMSLMNFADEKAIADHYQRVRKTLAEKRSEVVKRMGQTEYRLPEGRGAQIGILNEVCAKYSLELTAQFRDLKGMENLSDVELASMLRHLIELGLVTDGDKNEE